LPNNVAGNYSQLKAVRKKAFRFINHKNTEKQQHKNSESLDCSASIN